MSSQRFPLLLNLSNLPRNIATYFGAHCENKANVVIVLRRKAFINKLNKLKLNARTLRMRGLFKCWGHSDVQCQRLLFLMAYSWEDLQYASNLIHMKTSKTISWNTFSSEPSHQFLYYTHLCKQWKTAIKSLYVGQACIGIKSLVENSIHISTEIQHVYITGFHFWANQKHTCVSS